MTISRRGFLIALPLFVAGCSSTGLNSQTNYAALPDEKFPLRQVPIDKIKPELRRRGGLRNHASCRHRGRRHACASRLLRPR